MNLCLCGCMKEIDISKSRGEKKMFFSDNCRVNYNRKIKRNKLSVTSLNEDIRLYCGVGETSYNHHPVACGPYACISPVRGRDDGDDVKNSSRRNDVRVPDGTKIMQDSGAFSDGPKHRLDYDEALQRQKDHAAYYRYSHQITARASYDLLIDETWQNEFRHKERWSEEAGKFAVKMTVGAAQYLDLHRTPGMSCVMSAQGVTPDQYYECTEKVIPCMAEGDIFGLGGWCILSQQKGLLPAFRETISIVIPLLGAHKIKRVHIWGVCFAEPLGELLWLCDQHGVKLSTDSMGASKRPVTGKGEWGYASWRNGNYKCPPILDSCKALSAGGYKAPLCTPDTKCRGLERTRHVELTREWLANFRDREPALYHPLDEAKHTQLSLFMEHTA